MSRDQLKRLKELETKNARLRRVVVDLSLDKRVLSEAVKPLSLTFMHRSCAANFVLTQMVKLAPIKPQFILLELTNGRGSNWDIVMRRSKSKLSTRNAPDFRDYG